MAISTRKKNLLIAEWKTGVHKTVSAMAKLHKLDPKTVRKFIGELTHENADLVEACVIVEGAKKSLKNPIEIEAVEKAVSNATKIESLTDLNLEGLKALLMRGTISRPIKIKNGEFDIIEQHEQELGTADYKNAQDTIDKAMITYGEAPRHSNQSINLNTQNNQSTLQRTINVNPTRALNSAN